MRTDEHEVNVANGWPLLGMAIVLPLVLAPPSILSPMLGVVTVPIGVIWFVCLFGFYTLQPNEAAVLVLFGKYVGTDKTSGFRWANPFYRKIKVSMRARNLNMEPIKVNDLRGNPVEIAAVVVWRVQDTAQAVFDVDDFVHYVEVQSESALRHLAMAYPYDEYEDSDALSLRGSTDEISDALRKEIQDRVAQAGVDVMEAKLSHLAYAQEIAGAMLQRQQAEAIVAARTRIVDGAVGMVDMALDHLKQKGTVTLDEKQKADMVGNLLVVLCAHAEATPIISAGSK